MSRDEDDIEQDVLVPWPKEAPEGGRRRASEEEKEAEAEALAARRAVTAALKNPGPSTNPLLENACPYSPDEIAAMRVLGLPKPEEVSWGDWSGPKTINHRRSYLIQLAASGLTNNEIAAEMGMSIGRVSVLLSNTKIRAAIAARQDQLWGDNSQQRFKRILNKAIDKAEELLDAPDTAANLQSDIAFKFMDRALGKPKQEVAVEGNLLADFIHKLDQEKDPLPKDVTGLDSEKDAIDEYLEKELPQDFVIGKRNANEEEPNE